MTLTRSLTACLLVALLVLGWQWLSSARQATRISIQAPDAVSALEAPVPDLLSEVNLGLSVELDSLARAIDTLVPREFSGFENDPVSAAARSRLTWSLAVGPASLGAQGGALTFRIPISDGLVNVEGHIGPRVKNKGPLGWLERLSGYSFDKTIGFEGVISGVVRPQMRSNWTIDPGLSAHVDLSEANLELFRGLLTFSFRDVIEKRIDTEIRRQAEQLRSRLADDGRIVSAVQRAWDAMHAVVELSSNPSVWMTWQPVSLAVSQPLADDDRVAVTLGTMVRAAIDVVPETPLIAKRDLPRPTTPRLQDEIVLRVPVTMRLDRFQSLLPEQIGLPQTMEYSGGSVLFRSLSIFGVADELTVAVDVLIDMDWMTSHEATLYVTGKPVFDRQRNRLSLADARYEVETRDALVTFADFMLEPFILDEIKKRSVFEILEAESELLRRARAEVEVLATSLPAGIDAQLQINSGQVSTVLARDGWLVAVLEVTGRARVQVSDLQHFLELPDTSADPDTQGRN